MQRKSLIAACVAAAFALPFAATAADTKDKTNKSTSASSSSAGGASSFKSLDKNGDGFISKDELKGTAHESNFDQLDRNHDGKLSSAEFATASSMGGSARSSATGKDANTTPAGVSPPGKSATMPNSPPPSGNTKGQKDKVQ